MSYLQFSRGVILCGAAFQAERRISHGKERKLSLYQLKCKQA